eukprot:GEMP01026621.1.p1 GENE.GEMP01026621.1~~GEMP01026621.1.p1  ORF type:complete len:402 (+),score=89.22 GEMP01026621.1:56-1207(+)
MRAVRLGRDIPHQRATLMVNEPCERRLLQGHLWIYKRDQVEPVVGTCVVNVVGPTNTPLGAAAYSARDHIVARVFSPLTQSVPLDSRFFADKFHHCVERRSSESTFYRLCNAEGDGLPGITVDRFGDYLAISAPQQTADPVLSSVVDGLESLLHPKAIVLRRNTDVEVVTGNLPSGPIEIQEHGLTFPVDLLGGQKTGWYYDLAQVRRWVAEQQFTSVLDLYGYTGAFGLTCAKFGALRCVVVDSSPRVLSLGTMGAEMNMLDRHCCFVQEDAQKYIEGCDDMFDVVIVDPPSLAPRKENKEKALKVYEHIISKAAVRASKMIVVCSCSHHVSATDLAIAARRGLQFAQKSGRVVLEASQAPDHPWHLSMFETKYLSVLAIQL